MNYLLLMITVLALTTGGTKVKEKRILPLCRPGNQNSTATPYTTHLGDTITIFCPFSHCCEGCTIDHYNNQSGEYDEISRGACRTTIHISDYDDGGWYKCGCSSGCSNDAVNVTQCVHNVQVLPTRLELDFPTNVILGDNYTGTCRATGNPRPNLYLASDHCRYEVDYASPDKYTAQAVIRISHVMMKCKMIYCSTATNYNPLLETISLNITERITTTSQPEEGDNINIPTNGNGSAASLIFSTNILMLLSGAALMLTVT